MTTLSKQYNPSEHEEQLYAKWEEAGLFGLDKELLAAGKEPFVISLPPPNITGSLHMGHALQDTIMDILSRYHRMQGRPVAWLPGTDSAAIATNRVIESQLAAEGTDRFTLGREAFMERVAAWYEKTGSHIVHQMKRLGCSCDWDRARFTMDEDYVHAVNEVFVRYYEQGYIYRGSRIVNWDPATKTTVSDLEVEYVTEKAPFYYFKYGPFEIGTARPETKFGDKYVVVHPDDERYVEYKHGDTFEAEWINGPITATVIKDEASDPAVGSGAMTITPWHSAVDFELAQKHDLEMEQIIDFEGNLLPIAGELAGVPITEARQKIVDKLDAKGLLVRVDDAYEHNVAVNDRGKGVIEPQVMRQWFVAMDKLKQPAIDAAKEELVRFVPSRWKDHFISWMEGVYDWNINRQIWLGHRLPVWWKKGAHGTDNEDGNFVVSVEPPAGEGEWEQDPDVLDTWFATALWPFAQQGWPDATDDLRQLYPTSVLVTARDIMYLWVARMVFSGLELMQGEKYGERTAAERIPFKDVFIHPTVMAKDGRRMSKSLGTGVDPLDLIEEYGADATRFGLMYMMSYDNQAIKFDEATIETSRNFANKLWNIVRFIEGLPEREEPSIADDWIQQRLADVMTEHEELIAAYKIGEASRKLYDFVWGDVADWYVEILKTEGSTVVARRVLVETLALLHPFMPYVTEVLYQQLRSDDAPTWLMQYQQAIGAVAADATAVAAVHHWQEVVRLVRSVRTLLQIPAGATVTVSAPNVPLAAALGTLARAEYVAAASPEMKTFPLASGEMVAIGSEEITEASIAAAVGRLQKEQQELAAHVERTQKAISAMEGKAPAEVIEQKQASIAQAQGRQKDLEKSLAALR